MHLPAHIGDYTDFYACMEHTKNGTAIRTGLRVTGPNWCVSCLRYEKGSFLLSVASGARTLLPCRVHLPVAYHSRSSSVVISGTDVKRPR